MSDFDSPTGDDTTHRTLLASLYLDDEATADERALVETDPDGPAEVERLGEVRTVLAAAIETPTLSEREAHLASALDVWARTSTDHTGEGTPALGVDGAAGAAVTTPASSSDTGRNRRPSRSRWVTSQWVLGVAAALVLVAGVGAVLAGVLGSGDDSNEAAVEVADEGGASDGGDALDEAVAAEVADENTNASIDPTQDLSEDAAIGSDEFAQNGADTESTDAMEDSATEEAEATSEGETEATSRESADDTADTAPAPPLEVALMPLDDLEQLATFANFPFRSIDGDAPATTQNVDFEPPVGSCAAELGIERIVDAALYQGAEVTVGVDLPSGEVFAYTEPDCDVVARTTLSNDPNNGS